MQLEVKNKHAFREEDDEDIIHDQTVLNADHIGTNIKQLEPGDHIAWERLYAIWHHAIVENTKNGELKVIHFDGKLKREEIKNTRSNNSRLFRINYPQHVIDANPADVVLERATSKRQDELYDIRLNNCEHLATYWKTGKRTSYQVKWAEKKAVEVARESVISASKTLVGEISRQKTIFMASKSPSQQVGPQLVSTPPVAKQLAATKQVGKQPAVTPQVGKQSTSPVGQLDEITQVAPNATKVAKWVNRIGTAAAIVAEVWATVQDINKFAQQRESEQISASHANQLITERISESVIGSVASHYGGLLGAKTGALLGAQIGSLAGPAGTAVGAVAGAVVGGFLGSFASTSVGKCIGTMVGRSLGRWFWW